MSDKWNKIDETLEEAGWTKRNPFSYGKDDKVLGILEDKNKNLWTYVLIRTEDDSDPIEENKLEYQTLLNRLKHI